MWTSCCNCTAQINVRLSKRDEQMVCSVTFMLHLILGSCERTSLKVAFWSCDEEARLDVCVSYVCVCVCACLIWVTSSHLVLALWSQACFLFSLSLSLSSSLAHLLSFFLLSSYASQDAATIWHRALKSRPRLSHQNGVKIYPHVLRHPVALSRVSHTLQPWKRGLNEMNNITDQWGHQMWPK